MPFDSHGLFQWPFTFQGGSSAFRLGKPAYFFVVVCRKGGVNSTIYKRCIRHPESRKGHFVVGRGFPLRNALQTTAENEQFHTRIGMVVNSACITDGLVIERFNLFERTYYIDV
jgi:hypothetical protein